MPSVGNPILSIHIPDTIEDDADTGTIPYTSSPLDTCRGGKGFQVQRKPKDTIGNGNGAAKKDKKESKGEKAHARY